MVKKRIRKIKPKIKIIREIRKGEDIDKLTSSEVKFSEAEMDNVTGTSSGGIGERVVNVPTPQAQTTRVRRSAVREEVVNAGGQLYEVGKSMGGTAKEARKYESSGGIGTSKIQEVGLRGPALQGGFALPEDQIARQADRMLREGNNDKNYQSNGGMEGGGRKTKKRYAWEV